MHTSMHTVTPAVPHNHTEAHAGTHMHTNANASTHVLRQAHTSTRNQARASTRKHMQAHTSNHTQAHASKHTQAHAGNNTQAHANTCKHPINTTTNTITCTHRFANTNIHAFTSTQRFALGPCECTCATQAIVHERHELVGEAALAARVSGTQAQLPILSAAMQTPLSIGIGVTAWCCAGGCEHVALCHLFLAC